MPIYEYCCDECLVFWEKEARMGKAPKRTKCPSCSKLGERYYSEITFNFADDGCGNTTNQGAFDFHSVRQRYRKFQKEGFDKDSANKFLKRSINGTKERLSDRQGRYKSVSFNYDKLAKDGVVKKLSDKESAEKMDRCNKITEDISNRHTRLNDK